MKNKTFFRPGRWLLLYLVLFILLLSPAALAAEPLFSLSAEDGEVGDSITVSVSVLDNPGMCAAAFGLVYDSRYLRPTAFQPGSDLGGITGGSVNNSTADGDPMVSFSYINSSYVSGDIELCSFTFTIVGMPPGGSASLSLVKFATNAWFRDAASAVLYPALDDSDPVLITGGEKVIAVTGLTLDKSQLQLETGGEYTLIVRISPADASNPTVDWSSSNPSVARVFMGKVTALKEGAAIITATTVDGGFSASCRITVLKEGEVVVEPEAGVGLNNFVLSGAPFPFADVSVIPGNWVYESVYSAYQLGLMKGFSQTVFAPRGDYRVSEALMTAARLHNIYYGGSGIIPQPAVWYEDAVKYCLEQGIIQEGDFDSYTRNITRSEMAYVFAHALPAFELAAVNNITALPDVDRADPYGKEIFLLYNAGVLRGNDDLGTYLPNSNISRREAAAIISRMALPGQRVPFTPPQ